MNLLHWYFLHFDFQKGECLTLFAEHISLNSLKLKVKREGLADRTVENACVVCSVPRQDSTVLRHSFIGNIAHLFPDPAPLTTTVFKFHDPHIF